MFGLDLVITLVLWFFIFRMWVLINHTFKKTEPETPMKRLHILYDIAGLYRNKIAKYAKIFILVLALFDTVAFEMYIATFSVLVFFVVEYILTVKAYVWINGEL